MFLGVLKVYLQSINTQNLTNLKQSQNLSKRMGFSQNSSNGWIFVLELNLPKPIGGNDSQMSLHVLIQPKSTPKLRFKEITQNQEKGDTERGRTPKPNQNEIESYLEAQRTRGG